MPIKIDLTMGQRLMQRKLLELGILSQKDLDEMVNNGVEKHGAELRNDIRYDCSMSYTKLALPNESCELILFDPPFKVSGSIDEKGVLTPSYLAMREEMRTKAGNPRDFIAKFGAYHSRQERDAELAIAFSEIYRVLTSEGECIFKWDTKVIPVKNLPLGLLRVVREVYIESKWARMHETKGSSFLFLKK